MIINYEPAGYVSDEDAEKIDYPRLLQEMQAAVRDASKRRVERGYEPYELVGWAHQPYYDKATKKLELLADVSPWLPEAQLADMKPIKYTSRDGLVINGYLTLPRGVDAKNLPVVINPHGGPWARDVWRFNPEVQFLANRGYAVFQMNFRGSTGYGRKFWESSFKQWGKTMQDDVTDGVQWLIKEGIADPKRVAIYGGSYGGYTTLAGITFTPDLYAAAVDYVGVSNLFTFMKTIPPYWKPYLEMFAEMVGDMEKDKGCSAASPDARGPDQDAAIFIAQGARIRASARTATRWWRR